MINKISSQGFTLIETLVAVFLLVTAIAGPLTIASKSLIAATSAKDQVTAYYLAQDAMEFIRFARDTNRLSCGDWLTGAAISGCGTYVSANITNLTPCVNAAGTSACYIDSVQSTVTSCGGATCANPINYDSTAGRNYFSYTTGSASKFRRSVTITNPLSGRANEAQVLVVVSWTNPSGVSKSVTIQENLFNWQ